VSAGNEAATEDDAEAIDVTAAVDSELARIEAILASGGPESDGINKALAKIDKRSAATCTAGKLEKAIKKKSGAFSTLVEFCVEEGSKRDVEDVSRACRMGKAAAIVVDVGFSLAGHDRDTMLTVVSEQTKSKGNFPGPCPIVLRHCALVAAEQVAEASVLGVNALMLPSAAVLSDGATVLSAASALGLEVVVEVDDQESVSAALDAGARIICIRGVGSLEEALELRKTVPQEVAVLAAIPAQQEDDAELGDVAEAKGAAFDGVVLMEAVIEAQNDLEYCIYMLPAIQSKKSSTFAFAAIGTQEGLGQDGKMMPAAEEAMKRNPRAWQKAQREAKQIVGDYKRGVRSLGGDKGSKL
jgi:indole-3-glycerol phosphate synthase